MVMCVYQDAETIDDPIKGKGLSYSSSVSKLSPLESSSLTWIGSISTVLRLSLSMDALSAMQDLMIS